MPLVRHSIGRALTLGALLVGFLALPVRAQVTVGGAAARIDDQSLARVAGPQVGLQATPALGPFRLRASLGLLQGASERVGSICTPLTDPAACVQEPLRDDARLTLTTLGLSVPIVRAKGAELGLIGEFVGTRATVTTHGLTTAQRVRSSRNLYGWDVGARAAWQPSRRAPLSVTVEGTTGYLAGYGMFRLKGGWVPADRNLGIRTLRAGLSWH